MFSFEGREWEVVTEAAKDMITQMLVMDFSKRATAKSLLQHRWFQVGLACAAGRPGEVGRAGSARWGVVGKIASEPWV